MNEDKKGKDKRLEEKEKWEAETERSLAVAIITILLFVTSQILLLK